MAEVQSLNHSAICVHDLHAAEQFYCGVLGARKGGAVNFDTEDVIKGRSIHTNVVLADYLIALMLAHNFMPMPPAAQLRGTHGFRHAFAVPRDLFGRLLGTLQENQIAFEGPIDHPEAGPLGQSIYCKDPSGNFLEFVWRRDEAVEYDQVEGIGEG